MAKIRALLAILTITCGLLLGSIAVSAAEISKPGLSAGDTSVRAGQEMEFVFSLDGYYDIQTGINTIKGTFEYDSDIFEDPAQEDFEPLNSWESVRYNPSNRQFVLIRRANDAVGGEVVRITAHGKREPAGWGCLCRRKRAFGVGG